MFLKLLVTADSLPEATGNRLKQLNMGRVYGGGPTLDTPIFYSPKKTLYITQNVSSRKESEQTSWDHGPYVKMDVYVNLGFQENQDGAGQKCKTHRRHGWLILASDTVESANVTYVHSVGISVFLS